ncbi:MAG: hypothetical protein ACI9VR_004711 [Cognaticolwellia sp.]
MAFRFEPELAYKQLIVGSYNQANGNLVWRTNYGTGYFLKNVATADDYDSYGTIFRNGNVDVRGKYVQTDGLDRTQTYIRRDQRSSCEGTLRFRMEQDNGVIPRDPQKVLTYTIVSDDKITWEGTNLLPDNTLEYGAGEFNSDGRQSEAWNYSNGSLSYDRAQERKVAGALEILSSGNVSGNAGYDYVYDGRREFSGASVEEMTYYASGTDNVIGGWTAARTATGQGSGTAVLENGAECNGSFSDWDNCAWDCDGVSDCPAEPAL